jgi:hypothetical protein
MWRPMQLNQVPAQVVVAATERVALKVATVALHTIIACPRALSLMLRNDKADVIAALRPRTSPSQSMSMLFKRKTEIPL